MSHGYASPLQDYQHGWGLQVQLACDFNFPALTSRWVGKPVILSRVGVGVHIKQC